MSDQQPASSLPGALPANVAAATADLVRLRHAARDLTLFPRLPPRAVSAGGHQSRFRGRGMDFDEVRPYQPGDDIRTIDWRVTARTTQTHTKVFREERERPVIVVVDLRQTMFFGTKKAKSVAACEVAAALAWAGFNAGDRVGGLVFAPDQQRDIRARRSHHSVLQLIRILSDSSAALIKRRPDRFSLTQIFEDTRRIAHPGAAIVFISDFHDFDRDAERHLFELARHSDLTLCHIYDDLDVRLPPPGSYPVINGGHRFTLNTRNARVREAFELSKQKQFKTLQQATTRLRAAYLQVRAGDDVMPLLQSVYSNKTNRRRRR